MRNPRVPCGHDAATGNHLLLGGYAALGFLFWRLAMKVKFTPNERKWILELVLQCFSDTPWQYERATWRYYLSKLKLWLDQESDS
jgi:hypothetical protein